MLSHTGDPNKGLRDWYENQKHQDDEAQVESEPEDGSKKSRRWNILRERVTSKAKVKQQWGSVRRNVLDGELMKQNTLGRIREPLRAKKKVQIMI